MNNPFDTSDDLDPWARPEGGPAEEPVTNADVMSASEMHEHDQACEAAQDAADEARWAAEAARDA